MNKKSESRTLKTGDLFPICLDEAKDIISTA